MMAKAQKDKNTEQLKVSRLEEKDRLRITCQDFEGCDNNADLCEVLNWDTGHRKGISFFYFCDACYGKLLSYREQRTIKKNL